MNSTISVHRTQALSLVATALTIAAVAILLLLNASTHGMVNAAPSGLSSTSASTSLPAPAPIVDVLGWD